MNRLLAVAIDPALNANQTVSQTYPTLSVLINNILKNSLTVAGVIFLILLIFGGIMFIINAGSGDSKKAGQAQTIITDALIGFAFVLLSYFIIQIIEVVTGVSILNPSL